ncbi:hypothetical protein [Paenarthrobacter sp. NEAU-H11]|uniref:hypothetical protein n=1 Tax=Paenarthrobacter sp. NEAU-H11 TaxID=3423924 RepID=UPI003D3542C1
MMEFLRQQLFNIIAFVFLGFFVAVWGAVLLRVGFWVPDGRTVAPPLNGALVTGCPVALAGQRDGINGPDRRFRVVPAGLAHRRCRGGVPDGKAEQLTRQSAHGS